MLVQTLELELTNDCNLKCVYCYRRKKHSDYLSKKTAFDAVIWFIHASAFSKEIYLAFMGGEPLLQFPLIKELVPFAVRRSRQADKTIEISATTNCTLITNEVLDFFKRWRVRFHLSVDGIPHVQNQNRPTLCGKPTSEMVFHAVSSVLKIQPFVCARATIVPENVRFMLDSYTYFRKQGFTSIAMVASEPQLWNEDSLMHYKKSLKKIAKYWKEEIKSGVHIWCHSFSSVLLNRFRTERLGVPCGAGRGLASIDLHGNIWPCNRWDSSFNEHWQEWKLGNIYEEFDGDVQNYFMKGHTSIATCSNCIANIFCAGGCYASNLDSTNEIGRHHSNACVINRIHAEIGIEIHDELYAEKCPTFMEHYYPEEWKKLNSTETDEDKNHVCGTP